MSKRIWGDKPYHSLDYELKQRFGEKVYKISLEGGMTCPNRDGTLGTGGCIFCSGNGSGDFASPRSSSIHEQIEEGIRRTSQKKKIGNKYIAYFQSFTNTYAPVEVLRPMFLEAIQHPRVAALSIATRPDCLPEPILELISECNHIKPVMVELGLQTIHETTAEWIRRGYPLSTYDTAVESLISRNIEVVTHVIAGLPHESLDDFLQTVSYVGKSGAHGIKLQLLHILKNTDLAKYYLHGDFQALRKKEYFEYVAKALCLLPEDLVIHRITGDGPKDLLIAPEWSKHKRQVLNELHHYFKENNIWQGKEIIP